MIYITNAFSLNMIAAFPALPFIREVSLDEVRDAVVAVVDGGAWSGATLASGVVPAVGHADTAALIDAQLGLGVDGIVDVPSIVDSVSARTSVTLNHGDVVYVAQYRGPRLPEGATSLPEGASIVWLRVDVLNYAEIDREIYYSTAGNCTSLAQFVES